MVIWKTFSGLNLGSKHVCTLRPNFRIKWFWLLLLWPVFFCISVELQDNNCGEMLIRRLILDIYIVLFQMLKVSNTDDSIMFIRGCIIFYFKRIKSPFLLTFNAVTQYMKRPHWWDKCSIIYSHTQRRQFILVDSSNRDACDTRH